MRDGERIKEKIEIILDSRQVVSIVLGAAVVLGTVFYLGVTVGRDLAGAEKPAAIDPLERLDQQAMALQMDETLTFAESLTGEPLPTAPAAIGKAVAAQQAAKADAEKAEAARAEAARAEAAKAEAAKAEAARAEAARAEAAKAEAARAEAAKAEAAKAVVAKAEPARSDALAAGKGAAAASATAQPSFTVQVGAFPTQPEAEALMGRLRDQGFSPYVVAAEVAGKGLFHRVRLGKFKNREEAKRYLEDLQRETSVSGFVAQVDG